MPTQRVSGLEIDEVSLVDVPANQFASVVIAKRATQEEPVADTYFDLEGQPIDDIEGLEVGTVIQDENGQQFEVEAEEATERELATVGKSSAFFSEPAPAAQRAAAAEPVSKSAIDGLRIELSKAVTEEERATIVDRTFEAIAKRDREYETRLNAAEEIAKAERTTRLTREYVSKAAEYNVPIAAEELGPVLMRASEKLSYEDCAVIHKALTAAGEQLFAVAGYDGGATETDPMRALEDEIENELQGAVAKGLREPISKQQAMRDLFDNDPALYDQYRRENAR